MRIPFSTILFEILFLFLVLIFVATNAFCAARHVSTEACVPISEARKHLGVTQCVRGLVQHVADGTNGAKFLSFCKNQACAFTVVIFAADVKKMGDLGQLEGRQVEIKGTIQDHDGRAEMVLRNSKQLGDSAFLLVPTVPTDYDVERRGHYSPGKYSRPKAPKKKNTKQGAPVSIEDPEEPQ
jgi:hypothetical protein